MVCALNAIKEVGKREAIGLEWKGEFVIWATRCHQLTHLHAHII